MKDGKMNIEAMPLNSFVLDTVVPIIMQAKEISYEKTMAAMKAQKDRDDAADLAMIEDCMRDAKLAFKGPVSYARQGCRTSIIDKKVEQMTRHWNRMVTNAKTLGRGLALTQKIPQLELRRTHTMAEISAKVSTARSTKLWSSIQFEQDQQHRLELLYGRLHVEPSGRFHGVPIQHRKAGVQNLPLATHQGNDNTGP